MRGIAGLVAGVTLGWAVLGIPLVGAQQQLGHADSSTTAGSYTTISHSLQRIGVDAATAAMLEAAK